MLSNLVLNFKKIFTKKTNKSQINEQYFKSLKKVHNSDEYKKNK